VKFHSSVVTQPRSSGYRLLAFLGRRQYKASPCHLVDVGCVLNHVALCCVCIGLPFWRCIGRLGFFFYIKFNTHF
jgi:hypothetical protein